jgi:hypothetical protein
MILHKSRAEKLWGAGAARLLLVKRIGEATRRANRDGSTQRIAKTELDRVEALNLPCGPRWPNGSSVGVGAECSAGVVRRYALDSASSPAYQHRRTCAQAKGDGGRGGGR